MDLPELFGLDIGNHSIKVAEVKRSGDSAELKRLGTTEIEYGMLDNASDQGVQALAAKVKEAKSAAGIGVVNCVASIPESPVFSRLLTLPRVADDVKLQETIHWELKPLIPVPIEEVDVAFLEIGEKDVNGQKMVDVFVVAAPKSLTDRYKKLAELAEINLLALETEALANARAMHFNYGATEKNMMIIDFGALGTDLVLTKDGIPIFTQSIATGSDALTKAIAADYGIALEQAEQYKRSFGLDPSQGEGKIAKAMEPIMQLLISEMQRTLTYFRERIGDTQATKIYMTGEAAGLIGLGPYLTQHLGLQAVSANPVEKMKLTDDAKKHLEQVPAAAYSVAIGLGIKDR